LWLLAATPALRWLIIRFSVPATQPWRTSCDTCAAPLNPAGAAWRALSPAGHCGNGSHRLGAPAHTVEVGTVAAVAAAVLSTSELFVASAALWWVLCAVPMAFVDLRVHRLPNPLTYGAAVGVVGLLTVAAATSGNWSALVSALVSAAVTGVVFVAVALLLGARGMGLGDVKLAVSAAGLAGWWGWGMAFGVILVAFLISGVTGAVLLATRRATRNSQIALGPSFIAATIAMLVALALAAH
jgi:leader peptidase (prepilin peptidase)/N-methyltransferase